jgi:DNA-binding NtrC family response regulator
VERGAFDSPKRLNGRFLMPSRRRVPQPANHPVTSPSQLVFPAIAAMPDPNPVPPSLARVVASHIRSVIDYAGGNKTQAAKILGIDRRALYRKLERAEEKAKESDRERRAHGGDDTLSHRRRLSPAH